MGLILHLDKQSEILLMIQHEYHSDSLALPDTNHNLKLSFFTLYTLGQNTRLDGLETPETKRL